MSAVLAPQQGFRGAVFAAEERLRRDAAAAIVEIPVEHIFADGVYGRKITIPAGVVVAGHIHKRTTLNFLLEGEMTVLTEKGPVELAAGAHVVSLPGTKRIAYARTRCTWVTLHATQETDPAKIEAWAIAKTEEEFQDFLRAEGLPLLPVAED